MRKNIVLLFASITLTIFLVEISLRIVGIDQPRPKELPKEHWVKLPERVWTEYHPVLGWVHQKNKDAVHKVGKKEVEVHTNSVGFRGLKEYDVKKPQSASRILCLGDSFVFGFGVGDLESFCARLEQMGNNIEALNSGVPGYGIDQILVYFKTFAKQYQPDYVLIGVFPEGFWRATRAFADSGHAKPYFSLAPDGDLMLHNNPVPPPYQLKINQFPELIEYGWLESILMKSALYKLVRKGIMHLGKEIGWIDPDTTHEWIVGRRILEELIKEVRVIGSEPVLIILPPDRWVQTTRKTSLRKALLRFIDKKNVSALDLTPIFHDVVLQGKLTDYYIEGDWHWTEKGHALAADSIAKHLVDAGLTFKK